MLANLDTLQLMVLLLLAIVAHAALAGASLIAHPLAWLTAAFFFLAAFSVATEFPYFEVLKYARVYTTLLIIVLGIFIYKSYHYGPACLTMLLFIGFYMFAAIWSPMPRHAFMWKGLYLTTVLTGITMAMSLRTAKDVREVMRILVLASAAFFFVMLLELARNPSAISHIGRFSPFGLNPNRVAQTMANMVIVSAFTAFHDPRKKWRTFGYVIGIFGLFLILLTGARGGLGMALIGSFALALPILKRPLFATSLATIAGLFLFVLVEVFSTPIHDRYGHFNFDSRETAWVLAGQLIRESPLIGHGWVIGTGARGTPTTRNLHSIYFQVFAETGIIGFSILLTMIGTFAYLGLSAWRRALREGGLKLSITYLAGAFVVAVLAHGVVESASMAGSTVAALMMGFGVGLIDRIHKIDYSVDPDWHRVYGTRPNYDAVDSDSQLAIQ